MSRSFGAALAARSHEQLEAPFPSPGLYGGLADAGWVLAHASEGADEFSPRSTAR